MYSVERVCLAWVLSEMELDLADECFEDMKNVTWAFARNAMFLVERHFKEVGPQYPLGGRIPFCEACSSVGEYFWKIFKFLMNCFEVFRLRDTGVVGFVLGWGFDRIRTYRSCRSLFFFWAINPHEPTLREADYSRLAVISYTSQDFLNSQAEIVWKAVRAGREDYVASLLRYGLMYLTPKKGGAILWGELYEAVACLFMRMKCRTSLKHLVRFKQDSKPSRRTVNVLRVVQLLALKVDSQWSSGFSSNVTPPRKKLRVDTQGHSDVDCFRCLKMLFDTIPEPFVTSQEIREVLAMARARPWSEQSEQIADQLIAQFEHIYPDGAGPPAPRSLQHLSRCQVRDNLRKSGALPHGFYDLVLPNSIRKYILLEESDSTTMSSPVHSPSKTR